MRGNLDQKTILGGILSLGVQIYVIYVAIMKSIQMLGFQGPDILQVSEKFDHQYAGVQKLALMQPYLEILEGGDNTVDLEAQDYRRFIHLRVNNIVKNFDEES